MLAQLGERVWPGMWKSQERVTAGAWTGTTTLVSVLQDGLHNYSGFSSKRISLSPFTKDFRGEEHLRVQPIFGRLGHLAEHSEFVKDKKRAVIRTWAVQATQRLCYARSKEPHQDLRRLRNESGPRSKR